MAFNNCVTRIVTLLVADVNLCILDLSLELASSPAEQSFQDTFCKGTICHNWSEKWYIWSIWFLNWESSCRISKVNFVWSNHNYCFREHQSNLRPLPCVRKRWFSWQSGQPGASPPPAYPLWELVSRISDRSKLRFYIRSVNVEPSFWGWISKCPRTPTTSSRTCKAMVSHWEKPLASSRYKTYVGRAWLKWLAG